MGFVYQNCLVCNQHKNSESTTKTSPENNIDDDEPKIDYSNNIEEENTPDSGDESKVLDFFCKQFQLSSQEERQLINLDIETPFCVKCAERLTKLNKLQEQLLLIQSEIFTIQGTLSLAILTENGNDNNNENEEEEKDEDSEDDRPLAFFIKNKKTSNVINTIRNNIRQRFKPKVILTKKPDRRSRKILPTQSTSTKQSKSEPNSTKVSQQVTIKNEDNYSDCEYHDPLYFDDNDDDDDGNLNDDENSRSKKISQANSNSYDTNKKSQPTKIHIQKPKAKKKAPPPPKKRPASSSSSQKPSPNPLHKRIPYEQRALEFRPPVKKSSRLVEKLTKATECVEIIEIDDTVEPQPETKKQDEAVKKNTNSQAYWEKRRQKTKTGRKKKYVTAAVIRKRKAERELRLQKAAERKAAAENVEYDMSWAEGDDDDDDIPYHDNYDEDFNPDLYVPDGRLKVLPPPKSNRPFAVTREVPGRPGVYQQGDSPWFFQHIPGQGWKCLTCNFTKPDRIKTLNHIHQVHDTTRVRCEVCNVAYLDEISLKAHICRGPHKSREITMEIEEGSGKFSFKGYEFERVDRYQNEGKEFKCSTCGFLSCKKTSMSTHIRYAHIIPNSLICEQCGKGYPTQSMLEKHMVTHDKDAVPEYFYCDQCPLKSKNRHYINVHIKVKHQGERFKCDVCDNEYHSYGSLSVHRKTTGHAKKVQILPENPKCDLCLSEFANETTFNKHLQKCQGRKKYSCKICLENGEPKDFAQWKSLQKHAKLNHNQDLIKPVLRRRKKPVDMDISQDQNSNQTEQEQVQPMDTTTTTTTIPVPTTSTTTTTANSGDAFPGASSFSTTTQEYQSSVIDYSNFSHGQFLY